LTLVIEDGSQVVGANSYADLTTVRSFATKRGKTLPATDAEVEVLVIKAMDYVESFTDRFRGNRVSATQVLSWPRECVSLFGFEVAIDEIPSQLVSALCQAVIDANASGDLLPTVATGGMIVEDTVGPITTRYSDKFGTRDLPTYTFTNSLLRPLFKGGGAFSVDRA
jgi:hypothetical protein